MKNKFIGIREFQRNIAEVLPKKGERLVITKHGRPIAVVLSISADDLKIKELNGKESPAIFEPEYEDEND